MCLLVVPDTLLQVEGREHYRFVVNAGGVAVDGSGGLRAQVPVPAIKIECADGMRAARAGKPHATLNPRDGVVPLHTLSVVLCGAKDRHRGGAAKVTMGRV
jgi:hypothetical protein